MNNNLDRKTILVNGVDLNYIEGGAGEAIIFVHGSLGDYRTWKPQFEFFSQRYRVFSYSRRYHYPNAWTGDGLDYSPSLHADDLIALIEALHLGSANVVGNSFGAYTALVAGIRRPELFRKLVIGEPPILTWLKDTPDGQPYWDSFMQNAWIPARLAFESGDLEQGVRLFMDSVSGHAGMFDRMPDPVRGLLLQNALSLKAETSAPAYFTEITPRQLEQIRVPMLFLRGEVSPKMFHLILDKLLQYIPNPHQATIPNASHSMASGNPAAYNQVVQEFLAGE